MPENDINLIVPEEYSHERIDKFLTESLEYGFSRSYIQKLIKSGNIEVNGNKIKQNYKVKLDDEVKIFIPEPEELTLAAQDIPIDIIYQDSSIAVINKPAGLVVHPGPGNHDGTLVNALLYHLDSLSSIGGVIRPGIVHRLDKDTSGIMVIAKNDNSHKQLSEGFAERRIVKKYLAVVSEKMEAAHGIIDRPIGRHPKYRHKMTILENGRESVTEYDVLKTWATTMGVFSKLDIRLHTGRTHQIRVHLSSLGNPVVGDPVYSKKWSKYKVPYLLLASVFIEFRHPESGEVMAFSIPVPEHINNFINRLDSVY